MEQLNSNWFLEGELDFEYKKYLLLAYLQHVSRQFAEVRLYPSFSDLIFHYNNLSHFRTQKQDFYERFPKHLREEEFRKLKLSRKPDIEEHEDLQEIDQLIDYAMPSIREQLKQGKEIYEYIDEQISIEPVGITPLYKREGYLFLDVYPLREVKVFQYRIVFFENADANYHGISLEPVDVYRRNLVNTYEAKKQELMQQRRELPNPATWAVYTVHPLPEEASLLPVAKRKMLALLKDEAA
jgi:hypothetical protein